jgi:hypothetical protein
MTSSLRVRDDAGDPAGVRVYRRLRRAVANALRRRLARPRLGNDVLSRISLSFDVMVYFANGPVDLYQIRQWLATLECLDARHPVFILTRDTETFRSLSHETELPIVNATRIATLDTIAEHSDIKLCLYVNQVARNFQALRYPDMMHTFICHGESEKSAYMASNQLKAYDFTFVAGDAALDRIKKNLIAFDADDRVRKVGRPQLDQLAEQRSATSDRTTVLYAPTWEGDRPSISYGSVESHGRAIVESLVLSPRHRLIYRPHPRTGTTQPSAAVENQNIQEMVARAARHDPTAGHRVDVAPQFGPQMCEADLMITDVSAVATDFLPTGKPLVITTPPSAEAVVDKSGMLGSAYELPANPPLDIAGFIDECITNDVKKFDRDLWSRYHFGDIDGNASARFMDACSEVIEMREKLVAEKRGGTQS